MSNQVDPSDPRASLSYSRAFFISDNEKYTLWNEEGERLTDDEYDYKTDFVAGYAMVKKENQVGVVNDSGKVTVELGKYSSIAAKGGLYLARDGDTNIYSLLTGKGKELLRANKIAVNSYRLSSAFAVAKANDKFYLFDYAGRLIIETEVDDEAGDVKLDNMNDFGAFYYNNKNVIFDVRSGNIVASFEGPRYVLEETTDNRKKILLKNDEDNTKYKIIAGGKIRDLDQTKYYAFTMLDDLIGYDNYSEIALLNDDYQVVKRVNAFLTLKDYNNFAMVNEDGDVEIYHDGKSIKTFTNNPGLVSGILYEKYYAISDDGNFYFYNLDGSIAINHNFKDIRTLFDKNHLAIVSDEKNEYYLINSSGNRVSDETAQQIDAREGGYELKNSDSKYAIGNKKGERITEYKYVSISRQNTAVARNIWTGYTDERKYDVIDADNNTIILNDVQAKDFYSNYFTVEDDEEKTQYYTYGGKLFYTSAE